MLVTVPAGMLVAEVGVGEGAVVVPVADVDVADGAVVAPVAGVGDGVGVGSAAVSANARKTTAKLISSLRMRLIIAQKVRARSR
jgi:hypothetical protein